MTFISILNDVLGPVMHGPSSSHTAGSFHIGRVVRSLLGEEPARASFTFDPEGSYAKTYRQQGVDLALAAGVMGWTIPSPRFHQALEVAAKNRILLQFTVAPLPKADHPNTVKIELTSKKGKRLQATAKSVGGGMIMITEVDGWPVHIDGKAYEVMVLAAPKSESGIRAYVASDGQSFASLAKRRRNGSIFLSFKRKAPLEQKTQSQLGLLAASAVGLIIARRATFAAEVTGCQVEIGAAGAMAAAAVVEAAGGRAGQAADAAAIFLQNTIGSVCDPVQGMCEIPCHTRNAAANAFICADLILGGYRNPIPLDETIDAVMASGRMLPDELRFTALGDLAVTPSALSLSPRRK